MFYNLFSMKDGFDIIYDELKFENYWIFNDYKLEITVYGTLSI